jgi:glycosyltransferase involved in cell wall biosynthesis
VRVQVVDPGGYVRPYDHALCSALAGAGLDVELVTTPIAYGRPPEPSGYSVAERFHRRSARLTGGPRGARRALRVAEHVTDMARYARHPGDADVRHFQWLPLEPLDTLLMPGGPRVLTMHNVIRRGTGPARLALTRRTGGRMDAVVVHTRHSARQLEQTVGIEPDRIHVIPHGPFDHLADLPVGPLPPDLANVDRPVVLAFGMVRDYKGVDLLIEALEGIPDAELWVVGMPLRMSMGPLHTLAERVPGRVRFVSRFVDDEEVPAFFARADVVALPYRQIDQSGVLFCALAFGKPIVLSAVGGFVEVAEDHGAAKLVPPGDAHALAGAIREILADDAERERLSLAATAAARGPYSWRTIAERTVALYRDLQASAR